MIPVHSFLLLLFSCAYILMTETEACVQCQNGTSKSNLTEEELQDLDEYHLQLIKARILAHLNMEKPPNKTKDWKHSFPDRTAIDNVIENVEYRKYDLRLLAKTNKDSHLNGDQSLCYLNYKFSSKSLPHSQADYSILRALIELPKEMWAHSREIILIGLAHQSPITINATDIRLSTLDTMSHEEEYHIVDTNAISQSHQRQKRHRHKHITLHVGLPKTMCTPFLDNNGHISKQKPLLALKIRARTDLSSGHQKRDLDGTVMDCEAMWDSNLQVSMTIRQNIMPCCRRKQTIDLTTIGWSHWILAPKVFNSYYCLGRCSKFGGFASENTEGATFYTHTMNGLNAEHRSTLKLMPCCAPVKFAPLTITTRTADDEEMTQTLIDVIVTQCGCM